MILSLMAIIAILHTLDDLYMKPEIDYGGRPEGVDFWYRSVKKLQSRVGNIMWNEHSKGTSSMLRWLEFKKMDAVQAEKALREHIRWRKHFEIDRLRDSPPNPKLFKRFPYNVTGHARNGAPLLLMPFGDWDLRAYVLAKGDQHTFDKYQGQMWEKGLAAVEKVEMNQGKNNSSPIKCYVLCDLGNLEYRQLANYATLQLIFSLVDSFENNYPEIVHIAYMINCDWVFESLLQFIQPFLDPGSLDKLKVYPKTRSKWVHDIRRQIHPSQLPYRYGGYSKQERKKLKPRPLLGLVS